MKKIIIATLMAFAVQSAFAYCEVISRRNVAWVGGHQESTYCGSSGCIRINGGYELPYSLKYDFWKGTMCY